MSPLEIDIAFCDLGLVVCDRRGATYTSQVHGNFCNQVSVRGFFVPLDSTLPEVNPVRVQDALRELLLNVPRLSEREADAVDALLANYIETNFLRVDRKQLEESGEAWVYVTVLSGGLCPLTGPGTWRGVLVWPNSD